MGSKIFFLLRVSTAIFVLLLISSEVGARDLAESSSTTDLKKKAKQAATEPKGINDAKYGGYGSPFVPGNRTLPGGYGYPPGGPVVPGYPTAPGRPVVPGYPTAPGGPVVPGYPTAPGGPVVPGYPTAPGGPVVPGYPTAPGGPVVPGYPTAPGGPVVPGYPTAPGGGYPPGQAVVQPKPHN